MSAAAAAAGFFLVYFQANQQKASFFFSVVYSTLHGKQLLVQLNVPVRSLGQQDAISMCMPDDHDQY